MASQRLHCSVAYGRAGGASLSQCTARCWITPRVARPASARALACHSCYRNDVLHTWLTQGMAPDMTLLHGKVLVSGEQLEAFSAASLPARPAERFAVLFKHRQQWAADELKPYIAALEVCACICQCAHMLVQHGCHSDLQMPILTTSLSCSQAPGQSTESLLLRYTRATQPDADSTIVYSAR